MFERLNLRCGRLDVLINVLLFPPLEVLSPMHLFLGLPTLANCPNGDRVMCLFKIGKQKFLGANRDQSVAFSAYNAWSGIFSRTGIADKTKPSLTMGIFGNFRAE